MNFIKTILFSLSTSLLCIACSSSVVPKSVDDFPLAVAKEFMIPEPERWTTKNGITIVLMSDHELPHISASLFVRGGTLWDNSQTPGSVDMMGNLMASAGAGKYSADELEREMERRGSGLSSSASGEFITVSLSSLKVDFPVVFELFSEVVQRPRFDQDRVELLKKQVVEGMRRRADDPRSIVQTSLNQVLFPKTIYGRVLTSRDARKISRKDLLRDHKEYLKPDGAYLVVSGDISKAELEPFVEKYFSEWQNKGLFSKELPEVGSAISKKIVFIEKPLQQATIVLGLQGVQRLPPDFAEIEVFNYSFGTSGFASALMRQVRSRSGLAYSVSGAITGGPVKGKTYIYAQTKQESAFDAIRESLEVLRTYQAEGVSQEELIATKAAAENSFVFNFQEKHQVLMRKISQELNGFPQDYDQQFIPKIRAVTNDKVKSIANKYWDLSQGVLVVVGSKEALQTIRAGMKAFPDLLPGYEIVIGNFDEKLSIPKFNL